MRVKRIICCLAAICMVTFTACDELPTDTNFPSVPVINVSNIDNYAEEVVALANAERAKAGVPEVPVDSKLMELAAIRAEELATSFSHTRPNGEGDQYTGLPDYEWVMCNLAYGYTTPEAVVDGWMNSPGHKRNMIYSGHDCVGAGCYRASNGTLYWCIIFYRNGGYYPVY